MFDYEDIILEKVKTESSLLNFLNLSETLQTTASIAESFSTLSQIHDLDSNNTSKPRFKNYCTFRHKLIHSLFVCYRRLNMPKKI